MTAPNPESFYRTFGAVSVRGFLHRPAEPSGDGLVLTHGAGGNCNAPLLVELAGAFAERGCAVLRCDLAYRQKRAFGPPRGSDVEDRAVLKQAVSAMRELVGGHVFLGGQSYGGRQASMLAAAEPGLVNALLLLSYPLHPPRYPQQLRTAHLPKLQLPALFVQGSRDPFGSIEEISAAMKLIPASTSLLVIVNAGHDLGVRSAEGSAGGAVTELASRIVGAFDSLPK